MVKTTGDKDKLRVGIAGYGIVGKKRRTYIDLHPRLQTVAVADRALPEDGTLDDGVRTYNDFEKLIRQEGLDVLFVCLSNDVAARATCLGLGRGLHVFCEKPPGRNMKEIKEVLQSEKERPGLKLKYGFNHRFHQSIQEAQKIIAGGELGSIINMRAVYGKSIMINYASDWRHSRPIAGGGILLDQGIHMVDLLRFFGGEFRDVHSFISNKFWNYDVEDNAYALMRSESGIIASLHSTATEWRHRFNLQVNLTGGALIMGGILSGTKSYGEEGLTIVYRGEKDGGNPREQRITYIEDNSWKDEIFEFADCILEDRAVRTGSSHDAYKTMELVYKIYCADKEWSYQHDITMN